MADGLTVGSASSRVFSFSEGVVCSPLPWASSKPFRVEPSGLCGASEIRLRSVSGWDLVIRGENLDVRWFDSCPAPHPTQTIDRSGVVAIGPGCTNEDLRSYRG